VAFVSGRSGDTILLGIGSCLMSFVGSSAELFNVVVWSAFEVGLYKIDSSFNLSLRGSGRLIVWIVSSNASLSR